MKLWWLIGLWALWANAVQATATVSWQGEELQPHLSQWQSLLVDLGYLRPIAHLTPQQQDEALTQATLNLLRLRQGLQGSAASPSETLSRAVDNNQLPQLMANLSLRYQGFERLRRQLQRELTLQAMPLPDLSPFTTMSLGQSHPELPELRRLMAARAGQTLSAMVQDRAVWDPPFDRLLRDYQRQHGLKTNGRIDAATRRHLEQDPADRIAAIRYSLRQWYQLPETQSGYTLLVNIPHYQLLVLHQGRVEMVLPVVVGAPDTPTPKMNSQFRSVTLNPSWTPPMSIVRGELLPSLQTDPNSLARQGFEWIGRDGTLLPWDGVDANQVGDVLGRYQLRQRPGRNNPLGRVRFNLTQSQSIYLHDTNRPMLFRQSYRALSHGCIRVDDYERVLALLMENESAQTKRSVDSALRNNDSRTVRVGDSVQVNLVYMPAWAGADDRLSLAQDVYGWVKAEPL
ncbi:L,D-transpeptidase family protein [Marinobacter hydrocarbonoclasticus]|nr:L,D-transpeptidase family protein [Marinobacter nauticus]